MSLNKFNIRFLLLCLGLIVFFAANISAQELERLKAKITAVSAKEANGKLKLSVDASQTLTYTSSLMDRPSWKLILEFPVVDFGKYTGNTQVNKGIIKNYKISQLGKSDNYIGKIEISFDKKPEYSIERTKNGIIISLSLTGDAGKGQEEESIAEIINIKNLLYSGENNKFVMILETSGKPEFVSYVLKNPLRIVFDIPNSKYSAQSELFSPKNNVIKSIRVESFPTLSRVFLDVNADKIPSFISKAESDKLIVEFSDVEVTKEKAVQKATLDKIDFTPGKDKVLFRLNGVGNNEYKVLKLKDTILVFDIMGTVLNKEIQKTYDTAEVSDMIKSFTVYQVKPVEEQRVRFVAELKSSYLYNSFKKNGDMFIEFFKEKGQETKVAAEKISEQQKAVPGKKQIKEPVQEEKTDEMKKTAETSVKVEKPVVITIKSKEESETKESADKKSTTVESPYKGKKVTINLKDAEIQHIVKMISEVAKLDGETLNIVISDDVKGKISIQLEEVPWDQILDVVLEVNNLGMKRIGNILRIMPKDKLKKEQEELVSAGKLKEKLGSLVLQIIQLNYLEASEYTDKVKTLLSTRGTVAVDKRNNSLIVNDLAENIDEAKKLIVKLDTPPQQVVIEARVVEATSDFSKEMGIQWGVLYAQLLQNKYAYSISGPSNQGIGAGGMGNLDLTNTPAIPTPYMLNLPAAVGPGAGGGINFALVNMKSGVGLDVQLTAMENKGVGKILSRPKIATINNIEAKIQQGSSIPYETVSDKGAQTQFIDATLELTVTPRITPDNSVILKVKVSNNTPNTALRSARGVPSIDKNEATTEILIRDGQTIVIGGIIRNTETKSTAGVPFLMDIPFLGWFFKKEQKAVQNRELLIFLTPKIIRSVLEAETS